MNSFLLFRKHLLIIVFWFEYVLRYFKGHISRFFIRLFPGLWERLARRVQTCQELVTLLRDIAWCLSHCTGSPNNDQKSLIIQNLSKSLYNTGVKNAMITTKSPENPAGRQIWKFEHATELKGLFSLQNYHPPVQKYSNHR